MEGDEDSIWATVRIEKKAVATPWRRCSTR
jgi:hypothetical protein